MRYLITILYVCMAFAAFGIKTIDTTENVYGQILKKKIYLDNKGQRIRATTFYKSGRVEEERFFVDNQDSRSVTYDTNGAAYGEWNNPEIEARRYSIKKIEVLLITALVLALFIGLNAKFISYKITYYAITAWAIIPLLFFLIFNIRLPNISEVAELILIALVVELPLFLLVLSVNNLSRNNGIPKAITVINILASCILLILIILGMLIGGGGGMIG